MNALQKYWSYVNRITVEKTSSKYNKKLVVAIQDGKYVLNATNANYSFASLHRVFQRAFHKIKLQEKNINSILVLGCGAGSIPKIIYKEMGLNPIIDAVEIDEKVIELGSKYFGLNQYKNLNVVIDDAVNYVKTTNNRYDLICVDVFDGINVPKAILTQEFLSQIKERLTDKGELLLNYVAHNYETKQQVIEIESLFNSLFSKKETYKLEGINRIFYAQKKAK